MKSINTIKITSSRTVKTVIKFILFINEINALAPIRIIKELHLSKDIDFKMGERISIQNHPFIIKDVFREIRNGHIYKIAIIVFEKNSNGIKTSDKITKEFNRLYMSIVRGIRKLK